MPAFFNIKIVAVTGYKKEGHKTLALNSGCDAVLVKPAGLTEIKAVLGSVAAVEKLPYQIPRQMSGHDKF